MHAEMKNNILSIEVRLRLLVSRKTMEQRETSGARGALIGLASMSIRQTKVVSRQL